MMLRGRVRSSRTLRLRWWPSMVSPGICTIGTHHASPMLARSAPCAIAMRSPSPVLFGGETAPCIGPRRKACTRPGSHSKPPVPRMTPRRARTLMLCPDSAIRTPAISPASAMSSSARAFGVRCDSGVEQALEQPGDQRGAGHAQVAAFASIAACRRARVSASKPTLDQSAGNEVIRSRHSPIWFRSNGAALSERPPVGCPPGSSGW